MTRLTTAQLTDIRERADKAELSDDLAIEITADDVPKLITEVEALISEKADARRKLDTALAFIAEYEKRGCYEIGTDMIRALLQPTKGALVDDAE